MRKQSLLLCEQLASKVERCNKSKACYISCILEGMLQALSIRMVFLMVK